jgi:hypothetical protein
MNWHIIFYRNDSGHCPFLTGLIKKSKTVPAKEIKKAKTMRMKYLKQVKGDKNG